MYRYMFLALLLVAPAFGQHQAADPRTAAGCGPAKTEFDVKTDKGQHSATQPESGKALVYVIEDVTNPHAMTFGTVTTRVGLDGNWVGANHGQSYISFAAEPGEHRVCVDWQSSLKGLQKLSGATDLTVEAGKTYYYRSEVTIPWTGHADEHGNDQEGQVRLKQVDDSEGLLLISKSAASAWTAKK
jgi:Protein of unknown function (DUF2846)